MKNPSLEMRIATLEAVIRLDLQRCGIRKSDADLHREHLQAVLGELKHKLDAERAAR